MTNMFRTILSPLGHLAQSNPSIAGPSRIRSSFKSTAKKFISTSSIRLEQPAYRRPDPRTPPPRINPLTLTNHDIPFPQVQLVQSDNSLSPVQPLSNILSTLSTETHRLTVVSASPPIVKLVDISEELKKKRAIEVKAKLQRKIAFEDKELQVSWGSAPGDLQHKLTSAKGMLEKGDRVQLVFAARKGGGGKSVEGGRITDERKKEIVAMFEDVLGELGSKWREDRIEKGLWVVFWGPKSSIRAVIKEKVLDKEVTKKQERDEKRDARRKKQEEKLKRSKGGQASPTSAESEVEYVR